ncbi:MAG: hypothetical protein LBP33_01995 [Candidatus Adiutrix sp.]|jgi:hypothetical protein|nr:hypothetical protein [Candidatus Adiutrix sp.]
MSGLFFLLGIVAVIAAAYAWRALKSRAPIAAEADQAFSAAPPAIAPSLDPPPSPLVNGEEEMDEMNRQARARRFTCLPTA